jgi:hypothetical protein
MEGSPRERGTALASGVPWCAGVTRSGNGPGGSEARDGREVTASPAFGSLDHEEVKAQEGQIGQWDTKPGSLMRLFFTRTKTLKT